MAYSAVITRTADWVPKTSEITYIYEIVETNAAAASEYVLGLDRPIPKVGTITLLTATWISGSNSDAKIAPKGGLVSGWSTSSQNEVFVTADDAKAAHINDQTAIRYSAKDGKLYIQSAVTEGATDNVIHTRITIRAGHGG